MYSLLWSKYKLLPKDLYMVIIPLFYGDINMRNKDAIIIRFLIERKNEELNILKISKELNMKEATTKLLVYRLMKYIETETKERIDRFYLIIIAQQFNLEDLES